MKKKVIIVEDDLAIRRSLAKKLTLEGFEVSEASDGEEGLRKILQEKPDLILLDVVMPVMDGLTMIKELCKEKCYKDYKIILLTNLSDAEKIAEILNKGVNDYLIKSDWKIDDVVKKVKYKLSIN